MKKVFNAALKGIYLSAVMFLICCIIIGFSSGDEISYSGTGMAVRSIAALIIGAGFGIPSMIYETELPAYLKVLIHMGTGVIVMLITSIAVGWIDLSRGWLPCLIVALVQIATAFLLWLLNCVNIRRDAKKMNERIAKDR